MKFKIFVLIFLFDGCFLNAEPFILHQAENAVEENKINAGIDFYYGHKNWNLSGVNYKKTDFAFAIYGKFSVDPCMEASINIPYLFVYNSINANEISQNGLGNIEFICKYSCIADEINDFTIAVAVELDFPTGNSTKGIGEGPHEIINTLIGSYGFSTSLWALLTYRGISPLIFHINTAYRVTTQYDSLNSSVNPADPIFWAFGTEILLDRQFTLYTEFMWTYFGGTSVNGAEIADSSGSTFDILPALKYDMNGVKIKAGMLFSILDQTDKTYDYKIISGISLSF